MFFTSTRKNCEISASAAIAKGISDEGGLFVPEAFPELKKEDIVKMAKLSYRMRIYSVQGRTLFHPKTVMEWLLKTLLCILGLFILHLLYGYSIYLVSK